MAAGGAPTAGDSWQEVAATDGDGVGRGSRERKQGSWGREFRVTPVAGGTEVLGDRVRGASGAAAWRWKSGGVLKGEQRGGRAEEQGRESRARVRERETQSAGNGYREIDRGKAKKIKGVWNLNKTIHSSFLI